MEAAEVEIEEILGAPWVLGTVRFPWIQSSKERQRLVHADAINPW